MRWVYSLCEAVNHNSPLTKEYMMCRFPEEIFETLGYYVYRLIDPRYGNTFYVGKGYGNRVFEHVNDELEFAEVDDDVFIEDEISAQMQIIRSIRQAGYQVKHIIHRYGLTENEAFEVTAALLDEYDLGELKVTCSDYEADRSMIDTYDLIEKLNGHEYDEPDDIDYVIIKIKKSTVQCHNGSIYEAARKAWRLNLDKVKRYDYVIVSIDGFVEGVYQVDTWYRSEEPHRVEFKGHDAPDNIRSLFIHKRLPNIYCARGNRNPVQYNR